PHMRTSFHHQPEAQHPIFQLSTSWQADYPIFRGKADSLRAEGPLGWPLPTEGPFAASGGAASVLLTTSEDVDQCTTNLSPVFTVPPLLSMSLCSPIRIGELSPITPQFAGVGFPRNSGVGLGAESAPW